MPFTPFHFGFGALVKAAAPRHFSFLAFATTQVAIDLESWYYLTRGDGHVHRILHTFLFGTLLGLAVGIFVWFIAQTVRYMLGARAASLSLGRPRPILGAEHSFLGVALGGIVGGLSHALLDGVMHYDIQPLRPFSTMNPLQGLIGWDALHLVCVVAGVLGVILVSIRHDLWRATA